LFTIKDILLHSQLNADDANLAAKAILVISQLILYKLVNTLHREARRPKLDPLYSTYQHQQWQHTFCRQANYPPVPCLLIILSCNL